VPKKPPPCEKSKKVPKIKTRKGWIYGTSHICQLAVLGQSVRSTGTCGTSGTSNKTVRLQIPLVYGMDSLSIVPVKSKEYPFMATVLHWWGCVCKFELLLTMRMQEYLLHLALSRFDYQHGDYCQHYL